MVGVLGPWPPQNPNIALVIGQEPSIQLMAVVLPQPFGPKNQVSPSLTSKLNDPEQGVPCNV